MYRRDALRTFVGVGLAGTLAGCATEGAGLHNAPRPPEPPAGGPESDPEEKPLRVADFGDEETDDGALRVFVDVRNDAEQSHDGTLTVFVRAEDDELTESMEITVDADETQTFEIEFDLSYESFLSNGSLRPSVSVDD